MTDRQHLRKAIGKIQNEQFRRHITIAHAVDDILAAVDTYVLDLIGEDDPPAEMLSEADNNVRIAKNIFKAELRERLVKGETE